MKGFQKEKEGQKVRIVGNGVGGGTWEPYNGDQGRVFGFYVH